MAIPSITYTFTNGTTADGTEVSQNFDDLVAALTDGTKSLTIDALTAGGTTTLNGSVVLGNAAADTITWNGTAPSILLDNAATDGGAVYFNGGTTAFLKSSADGATLTTGGFTNFVAAATGITAPAFVPSSDDTSAPAANYLYKANVPKAWGNLTIDAASPGIPTDGHNIASMSWSANEVTVSIDTDMANTTYSVFVQYSKNGDAFFFITDNTDRSVGAFAARLYDADGNTENIAAGMTLDVLVFGDQ